MQQEDIVQALQAALEPFRSTQSDHDNIIRLQVSMDAIMSELREIRRDAENRQSETLKASKDLESRLRSIESISDEMKKNGEAIVSLESRVRNVELGGAKLSGQAAVFVFVIPTLISLIGLLVNWGGKK